MLKYLQPQRKAMDVFPTEYKMNTLGALRRYFPTPRFKHCGYGHFGEPAYFGNSTILWALVLFLYRLTPRALAPMLLVFIRKES
jgi:hypothetical protein